MKLRALFAVALLTLVSHSSSIQALDQKTIASRVDRLRQMSEIDRSRFDRNLQEFQKLSDAEKARYRQLHDDLAKDSGQGGALTRLLQTYSAWVQTLTPTQRDELQKETVLSQKLALIRRFKDEQDEPGEQTDSQSPADATGDDGSPQVNAPIKKEAFPLKDVKAVMAVLVNKLPQESRKPEYSDPRLFDYLQIIQASVLQSGDTFRAWPSEPLLKDMVASLSKDSLAQINRPDFKTRRETVLRHLLMGFVKQARDTVKLPTEAEKLQVLEGLSPEERERIMNLPSARMNGYLVTKALEQRGGDALDAFKMLPEYNRQIDDLFQRLEVSPPPRFLQRNRKGVDPRADGKRLLNRPNRNPGDK
jgi:hypothetical protein